MFLLNFIQLTYYINNEDNFKNNNKGEIIKPEDDDDEEDDDEEKSQEEIIEDIKELRKKPLKDRTYFYKDELIKEDEDEYIEYKNYVVDYYLETYQHY